MIYPTSLGDIIIGSLQQVASAVGNFIPLFIGAVVVFIIGWIIAIAFGKFVEQIVRALKIDQVLAHLGLGHSLERAGLRLDSGAFVGGLVKWFLIVSFLLAAVNILGLTQVSDFLRDVLRYIPQVIAAALILIIAAMVAETVERSIRGSIEAAGYRGSLAGVVARWAIWIFAFVAAFQQLGIATALIQTVVTGLVAALAIAFGLAFGLGSKDAAAEFVSRMRSELRK